MDNTSSHKRICNFSSTFSELLPNVKYEFDINTIDSIDDIIILAVSYLRNHVATDVRQSQSALLLVEIDEANWHVHTITFENILNRPNETIWICGHCK